MQIYDIIKKAILFSVSGPPKLRHIHKKIEESHSSTSDTIPIVYIEM